MDAGAEGKRADRERRKIPSGQYSILSAEGKGVAWDRTGQAGGMAVGTESGLGWMVDWDGIGFTRAGQAVLDGRRRSWIGLLSPAIACTGAAPWVCDAPSRPL